MRRGTLRKRSPDRLARSVEGFVEPLGSAAASLGDVVAPAAPTADDPRGCADHLRGAEPALDGALGEARDQRDLAVVLGAEDHGRVTLALLDLVGQVEKAVLVALRRARDHPHAV